MGMDYLFGEIGILSGMLRILINVELADLLLLGSDLLLGLIGILGCRIDFNIIFLCWSG